MAIEDEIINISDIDIGTEILRTDKLLVETNNGTKLLEFKDFVIGTENISFYNVISSAFLGENITGAAQYQTISGYNLLSPGTNAGFKTSYEHLSGSIELTKVNNSAVTELGGVSGKIADNEFAILDIQSNVRVLHDTLQATDNETLKSVNLAVSAVNFKVGNKSAASPKIDRSTNLIVFTDNILDPTTTNEDVTFSNAGTNFSITYPTQADASFVKSVMLFTGTIVIQASNASKNNKISESATVDIIKNNEIVYSAFGHIIGGGKSGNFKTSSLFGTPNTLRSIFNVNFVDIIEPGDKIQLNGPGGRLMLKGSHFSGIKLNGA